MTWNTDYEPAILKINGSTYEVDAGADFVETVKTYSKREGYSKVKVFLVEDGVEEEIEVSEAPETIQQGMEIIVRPYEKAA